MARLRGYCINLPEQERRRQRLLHHLQGLPLPGRYSLFAAHRGADTAAERRGLSRGEDGLWCSVLALLEQALSSGELDDVDGLHILEDDAELSPLFCRWVADLEAGQVAPGLDVLFTDMYAGPSIHPRRQQFFAEAFADNRLRWLAGTEYTGCTTSWLIPHDRVASLLSVLRQAYGQPRRIPIDNQLRQLLLDGVLQGAVSVPFLTSLDLASQDISAIQDQSDPGVAATRRIADLLRRQLSVLGERDELQPLLPLLAELVPPDRFSAHLGGLIEAVQQDGWFRYAYDNRLLDQVDNPQASGPHTASALDRSASGL